MILHGGGLAWLTFDVHLQRPEFIEDNFDIRDALINHRRVVIMLRSLQGRQHQACITTTKKRHIGWHIKQLFEFEDFFLEINSFVEVGNGDLADAGDVP